MPLEHEGSDPAESGARAHAPCEPLPPLPLLPDRVLGRDEAAVPGPGDAPRLLRFPEDLPLQALLLTATRLMGAYGEWTVRQAGLQVSLSGRGVLRVLIAEDGLKASEVADRAWSNPATLTSVVNTLQK